MDTGSIDIEELKRLAEAATPGPWNKHYEGGGDHVVMRGECEVAVCSGPSPFSDTDDYENTAENAAYIAAVNPQAILALIEEIEDLRRQVKSMERY